MQPTSPPSGLLKEAASTPVPPSGQTAVNSGTPGPQVTSATAQATGLASKETASPNAQALKLQALILNPRRPSAIVNGRTLFVGDKLGEMRVRAIAADAVTFITGEGKVKVLRLPE